MAKHTEKKVESENVEKKTRQRVTVKYRMECEFSEGVWVSVGDMEFPLYELDSIHDAKIIKSLLLKAAPERFDKDTKFRVTKIITKAPEAMEL